MKKFSVLFFSVMLLVFVSCSDDKTTEPKNDAPTCKITSPEDNFTINKGDSVLVSVEAADDFEVSEINFYLDDLLVTSISDSSNSSVIHTDSVMTGKHIIIAVALDNEGLESSDSIFINVEMYISFQDQNLENKIRQKINKPTGQLYLSDVDTITVLDLKDADILSIDGLEYCTSIETIDLSSNYIIDVSCLSGLTTLQSLNFHNSMIISDISPLSELTNLMYLDLYDNNISDISPLSELTNLMYLDLYDNLISDISPLTELINLTELNVRYNRVTDISALSNLTKIEELDISENFQISNISALSGMTNMKTLILHLNLIDDISALSNMNNLIKLTLNYNGISDITPLSNMTKLEELYLPYNNIRDISPLSGLDSLSVLELNENSILDILPLVQNTEFASGDRVNLTGNPLNDTSINTYIPQLQARDVNVTFGKK